MLALQFSMVNAFARAGLMHRDAAKLLLRGCPQNGFSTLATEVIYLSGYVAECGLKALLVTHTPPRHHEAMLNRFKNPREIGHNLERLIDELERRNVRIPEKILAMTRRIRRQWSPQLRYSADRRATKIARSTFADADGFNRWVNGEKANA